MARSQGRPRSVLAMWGQGRPPKTRSMRISRGNGVFSACGCSGGDKSTSVCHTIRYNVVAGPRSEWRPLPDETPQLPAGESDETELATRYCSQAISVAVVDLTPLLVNT